MVATRLREGQDLKVTLEKLVKAMNLSAVTVISAVGSLNTATLRMAGAQADAQDIRVLEGPFEIVSLIGNLGQERTHLHMSISDKNGTVMGGHIKEGCEVHTTVEIVLAVENKLVFSETEDTTTGFGELDIQSQ